MTRTTALLALLCLMPLQKASAAIGLSSQFVDVVMEGLEPGTACVLAPGVACGLCEACARGMCLSPFSARPRNHRRKNQPKTKVLSLKSRTRNNPVALSG